jgi:hypothetical protein
MTTTNQINQNMLNNNQTENVANNSSDNMEFDFSLCFDYYYSYCLC